MPIEIAFELFLAGTLLSQTLRDAAALGLIGLLLYERTVLEKSEPLAPAWLWSVTAFLGANLLSAALSSDPRAAFEQLRVYPIGVLVFLGARRVVSAGGFARLAAVVLALIAVFGFDEVSQFSSGRSFLGNHAPVWGRFQGALLFPSDVSLLPILLPIGAAAVLADGAWRRVIGALAVALVAVAVTLSGTRSAWCALLLLALAVGWTHRRARLGLSLAAIAVLVSLAAAPLVRASAPRRLFSAEVYRSEKRLTQWRAALQLFREAPILGHGPHSFKRIVTERHREPSAIGKVDLTWAPYPHDIYLEALAGTGLLGFAALVGLLAQGIRALYARRRASVAARAALVSLGLFATLGLFDLSLVKDWVQLCFWLPLGIAAGLPSGDDPRSVTRADPAGGGAAATDRPPRR